MKTLKLFSTVAVLEAATGLALVIAPGALVALLIGEIVDTAGGLVVARVAGIAMISIATACWMARNAGHDGASGGLLVALLVYNGAIVLLLVHAAAFQELSAIGLWPATGAHAALAVWCATALRL